MSIDLVSAALGFIDSYGLIAIFVLLMLDAAMLLPLLPGELVMILAVTRFAHDLPSLGVVVVVATAASLVGSLFLYFVARAGGRRLVDAHPRLFMMGPERREKFERLFQRPSGQSLVLFLRVIPLTRILVNLPAGLAKMPFVRFVVLSTIGLFAFHAGFLYLTYEMGQAGSPVAAHTTQVRDAYGSPAWQYIQANSTATAIVLLCFGVLLSIRATIKLARRPEKDASSFLGTLATAALFWGGLAVLVGLWMDPVFVYQTIALTSIEPTKWTLGWPYEPDSILAAIGGAAVLFAWILYSMRRSARRQAETVRKRRRATSTSLQARMRGEEPAIVRFEERR